MALKPASHPRGRGGWRNQPGSSERKPCPAGLPQALPPGLWV